MGYPIKSSGFEYTRGRITRTAGGHQPIPYGVWTEIEFDFQAEAFGMSSSLPDNALIIPSRGEYFIGFQVTCDSESGAFHTNIRPRFVNNAVTLDVHDGDTAWRRYLDGSTRNVEFWYWRYADLAIGNLTCELTHYNDFEVIGVEAWANEVRTSMEVCRVG